MAYIRGGAGYVWRDSYDHVHFWIDDGYDGWDESVWHCDAPPGETSQRDRDASGSERKASGVAVPRETADLFVVMRLAELLEEGDLAGLIDRAVERYGKNGGCEALTRQREWLLRALQESRS